MTHRKQCGFTLLEIIVALAVLAIAMAALIKVGMGNSSNQSYLKSKTFAHWIALNKVSEYRLQRQWPSVGRKNGTELMAGQEWYWAAEVKSTPDRDIRRLEVTIRAGSESDDPVIAELVAFIGRPL